MRITYAETLYCSDLKSVAKAYLNLLPEDVTGLLSQGSSGCAIASGMIALSKRDLVHNSVRKEGEDTHSTLTIPALREDKWAIVDDFISTGKTTFRVLTWAKMRKLKVACVIVDHINTWMWREEYKLPVRLPVHVVQDE